MTGRSVLGYVGGIVVASALATTVVAAGSFSRTGEPVHGSDVVFTVLLALMNAIIAASLAALPFVVCLALGSRARLRRIASRLIAGVVAGLVIEPVFVFLADVIGAAPDHVANTAQILDVASHAAKAAALARETVQFAPWMAGYSIVAGVIYHLVAGPARERPAVSQVFV